MYILSPEYFQTLLNLYVLNTQYVIQHKKIHPVSLFLKTLLIIISPSESFPETAAQAGHEDDANKREFIARSLHCASEQKHTFLVH